MDEPRSENSNASRGVRWTVALIVILILGIVGYSGFARARRIKWMKTCQENLTKINGAVEQWALEKNIPNGMPTNYGEVLDHFYGSDHGYGEAYLKAPPLDCPSGKGKYAVTAVGVDPVCTSGLPGHSLSEVPPAITELELP